MNGKLVQLFLHLFNYFHLESDEILKNKRSFGLFIKSMGIFLS